MGEFLRRLPEETPDVAQAVAAAVEGPAGLPFADLRRRRQPVRGRHVWQVGGDDVGSQLNRKKGVALNELDAGSHAVLPGVAAGQRKGALRDVRRDDARLRQLVRESDGDHA